MSMSHSNCVVYTDPFYLISDLIFDICYHQAFMALRVRLLNQLLIVALSGSIFSLYSKKRFTDFIIFFCGFSKFYKITRFEDNYLKFSATINLPWGHARSHIKFGPNFGLAVLTFNGYTNGHTNRLPDNRTTFMNIKTPLQNGLSYSNIFCRKFYQFLFLPVLYLDPGSSLNKIKLLWKTL